MRTSYYATIVLLACLYLVGPKALAQPTNGSPNTDQEVNSLRRSGEYIQAIAVADEAIRRADSQEEKLVLNLSKIHICREIFDFQCFSDSLSEASEVYDKYFSNADVRHLFLNRLVIWHGALNWYIGEYDQLLDQAELLKSLNYYEYPLEVFFEAHQFSASGYHLKNQPFEARRSISRMIHGLMAAHAYGEITPPPDITARGIAKVIHLTHIVGDNLHARRLMLSLDDFVRSNIPKNTYPHADYLVQTSEILAQSDTRTDFKAAIDRLNEAYFIVSKLQIPEHVREGRLSYIKVLQTAYAMQIGELELANQFHSENPSKFILNASTSRQPFESSSEAYHAIASTILGRTNEDELGPLWVELFSQPTPFENEASEDARYYKLLRLYALGIAKRRVSSNDGYIELAQSAKEIVAYIEDRASGFSGLFPVPRFVDRFILADFIKSFSDQEENLPLAFQSVQLLQRNSRHTTGDYLYAKSLLENKTEKRLVHQWRSLNQGLLQVELEGLIVMADPKATEIQKRKYRQAHQELINLIDQSRVGLVEAGSDNFDLGLLPSIADVQAKLKSDEAILVQASYLDELISFCVRRSGSWLNSKKLEKNTLLDIKLLQLSLTATHPPNADLDAQFPLEASYRVYEALFDGTKECMSGVSKLVFIPSAASAGVPIEVLITEPKISNGESTKLSQQPWFLKRASVRYSGSVQEFLAGSTSSAPIGGKFLGIGDPQLGESIEVARVRSPSSLSAELSELAMLPNTRNELQSVSRYFKNSELLLGKDATEQGFRDLTTAGVDVVSFATHGVIADELTGLNEPALVLTPPSNFQGIGFAVNDGLLTGSEIAALNLEAELAILSACNTANYDTSIFASGLRSLSNAFQIAGTKSVLASLWPVETFSSEFQVTKFTELALEDGKTLDEALVQSKLALMSSEGGKYSHPRFWAPFILIGNSGRYSGTAVSEDEISILDIERENDPGSEYLHIALSEMGSVALSKLGQWNGERFSSILEFSRQNGIEGQVKSEAIGAGTIAISEKYLVAAGYSLSDSGVQTANIRAFDTHGNELWNWETYPVNGGRSQILDILIADEGEGSPVVIMLLERECCGEQKDLSVVELVSLFKGEELRRDLVDAKTGENSIDYGWLFDRGGDFLVVHSVRSPPATKFVGSSKLAGVADPCAGNFETRVTKIIKGNPLEFEVSIRPGLETRYAARTDSGTILAGREYDRCKAYGKAFVGTIYDQHHDIHRIWTDPQLINSNAVFANEVDGHLIVVSDWIRRYSSPTLVQGERAISFDPTKPRSENAYQFTETVVSKVSQSGEIGRAFLSSVSSVHPFAARIKNRSIFVYGSYSNSAMIGEFRW